MPVPLLSPLTHSQRETQVAEQCIHVIFYSWRLLQPLVPASAEMVRKLLKFTIQYLVLGLMHLPSFQATKLVIKDNGVCAMLAAGFRQVAVRVAGLHL